VLVGMLREGRQGFISVAERTESRAARRLLRDREGDRTLRAVLVGMLREHERR
jgi:hypothetical protein